MQFNRDAGVWASYRVARVPEMPPPDIFLSGAKLDNGRTIQFFVNRETNLVVVDVIEKGGRGGVEILRIRV